MNDASTFVLEETKKNIIQQYETLGLRASGFFANNIQVKGRELIIPKYGEYISDNASPKGVKKAPRLGSGIIQEWARQKGVQFRREDGTFMSRDSTAFLISRKIWRDGTDIRQGKRKGIDYEAAVTKALNDNLDNLANDIVFTIFD